MKPHLQHRNWEDTELTQQTLRAPSETTRILTGLDPPLAWEGAGAILEEAPSIEGPCATRADLAAAQVLVPEQSQLFFRLRVQ